MLYEKIANINLDRSIISQELDWQHKTDTEHDVLG